MKLLTSAVLFCLSTSVCYFTAGFELHKRQGEFDQEDNVVCDEIIASEVCSSGYYQELTSLSLLCNNSVNAETFKLFCAFNQQVEEFCGVLDYDLVSGIEKVCDDSSNSSCSEECRDHILRAQSELGCCVGTFNQSIAIDSAPFSYSLWSGCGVEPVTEQCPLSFTLPQVEVDPTCSDTNIFQARLQSVFCREQYIQGVRDTLSATDGCREDFADGCQTNRFGTYCELLIPYLFSNLTAADRSCTNTSTCDPLCMEALSSIMDTVGCCFNDEYNATGIVEYDWLSYEFWSMCGLQSPGLCDEFLNNDAPFITIPGTTTTEEGSSDAVIPKASGISLVITITSLLSTFAPS